MKILLLQDYSGFHKNLKDGLLELGHEVSLATNGDGYKQTSNSDLYLPSSKNPIVRRIDRLLFPFSNLKDYYNYDAVQLVTFNIFGTKLNYNHLLLNQIKNNSGKMFLASCGNNNAVYKIRNSLEYNPLDANVEIDNNGINPYLNKNNIKELQKIGDLVDGIIPSAYTYAEAFRNKSNLLNTIQFPINVNEVKYIPQKTDSKIKIFHGITREGFKGTKFIKQAMEELKKNYPEDVEILIDGKMPLKKYLKVLEETNIVVDQALSYEYGMNALYSMAMGKVVLSGNEPEAQKELGCNNIPVINIKPSVEDIYNKLENLILNRNSIKEIGFNSRKFVEDFHDHVKVAQKYVDTWNIKEVNKK